MAGRKPETEPGYRETQVLLVLSPTGTPKADISRLLDYTVTDGDIGVHVQRLIRKGLVQITGMARRRQAPPSKVIAPTEKGLAAIKMARQRGVR